MNKIIQEERKFVRHLNDLGLKVSQGRRTVFKEAMRAHGHFTAEDLVKRLGRDKRNVSRATIYRSIKELLEAGVIRKTAFGEKHDHYEHVYDEKLHHHARCIHCHSVIEFPCVTCDRGYLPYLSKEGFYVLGHEMHFYGICQNCLIKGKKVTQ